MYPLIALIVLGVSVLFCASSVTAQGRIYKWVDAQGRVHYSDTPVDQASSIDEELPPASSFGTSPDPQSSITTSTVPSPEISPSPPTTAPELSPEPSSAAPPADIPPDASFPEDDPDMNAPTASEEAPFAGDDPLGREEVDPTISEDEDTFPPPQAAAESFDFTAFDNFVPGGWEEGEALDKGSLAAERMEGAVEDMEQEEAEWRVGE